jgi:hypothetical protein
MRRPRQVARIVDVGEVDASEPDPRSNQPIDQVGRQKGTPRPVVRAAPAPIPARTDQDGQSVRRLLEDDRYGPPTPSLRGVPGQAAATDVGEPLER